VTNLASVRHVDGIPVDVTDAISRRMPLDEVALGLAHKQNVGTIVEQ
jgi:hypothetical protein